MPPSPSANVINHMPLRTEARPGLHAANLGPSSSTTRMRRAWAWVHGRRAGGRLSLVRTGRFSPVFHPTCGILRRVPCPALCGSSKHARILLGRRPSERGWPSALRQPPALAHVGHGDEFQADGERAPGEGEHGDRFRLLGNSPTQAASRAGGVCQLNSRSPPVVDSLGWQFPLVFVKYGSKLYRFFPFSTRAVRAIQIAVTDGVTVGEKVVDHRVHSLSTRVQGRARAQQQPAESDTIGRRANPSAARAPWTAERGLASQPWVMGARDRPVCDVGVA